MKEVKVMLGLVGESISFAVSSLKSEKLRTFLSLFGVTIGIFSIVTVLCSVSSLEKNILEGIKSLGSDAMFIDIFPMTEEDENGAPLEWWEYLQRPPITEEQFEFVSENLSLPGTVVYSMIPTNTVSFGRRKAEGASILMTTEGVENVMNIEVAGGRNFSTLEYRNGMNVAMVGDAVASELFGTEGPLGQRIKVFGSNTVVVGLLQKQGESMASIIETDNSIVIPWQYGKQVSGGSGGWKLILAAPGEGVDKQAFKDELRILLRSCRGLSPSEKDNFSISEMTFLLNAFEDVFSSVSLAGWIIGAFSLLIGGFGIANIMFVSVRERMNQIGIQKALGAKKYVILTQYLVEASVLSVAGGLIGMLLVWVLFLILNSFSDLVFEISLFNAVNGMVISIVIGVLAGIIPAYQAATVEPVKAINA